MANPKNYKALLIRSDARQAIDDAKKMHAEVSGMELNYSQFISMMCKKFMSDMKLSKSN
jgi:Mrp family chromosome partitioning ATPase